jgi:hypothetical protein
MRNPFLSRPAPISPLEYAWHAELVAKDEKLFANTHERFVGEPR